MNTTTRIEHSDNLMQAFAKLHENDQEARMLLNNLLVMADLVDPGVDQIGVLKILDNANIYGARIVRLYTFVCDKNLSNMLIVLEALKTGKITQAMLDEEIDATGAGLDVVTNLGRSQWLASIRQMLQTRLNDNRC
jgi:hypothetical protein